MVVKVESLSKKRRLEHQDDVDRMVKLLMQHEHDQAGFTTYGNFDVFHRFLQAQMRVPSIMASVLDIEPQTSRAPIIKVASLGCVRILLGKQYVSNVVEILQDPHLARQLDLAADQAIHPDTYRNLLEQARFNGPTRLEIEKRHWQRLQDGRYLSRNDDGVYGADTTYIPVPPQCDVPEIWNYQEEKTGKYLKVGFLVKLQSNGPPLIVCSVVALGTEDDRQMLTTLLDDAATILGCQAIQLLVIDRGFYDGAFLYDLKTRRGIDFIIPPENVCQYVRTAKAQTDTYTPIPEHQPAHRLAVREHVTDVPEYPAELTLVLDDQRSEAQRQAAEALPAAPPPAEATATGERAILERLSLKQLRAVVQEAKAELRRHYQARLAQLKRPSKRAEVRAERDAALHPLQTAGVKKADLIELIWTHLTETRAFKLALQMRQPTRKARDKISPAEKRIHSYLTSATRTAAIEVITTYRRRSLVDNAVIKILKTYLTLENWPSHHLEAIKNHVLMVCLMFNVIGLFKSQRGRSFTGQSIAKLRSEFLGLLAITIYAGQEYVILTIEEFAQAVARSVGVQLDPLPAPP